MKRARWFSPAVQQILLWIESIKQQKLMSCWRSPLYASKNHAPANWQSPIADTACFHKSRAGRGCWQDDFNC
ncbi:hypothetical protein [Ignatzschineria indica]|uniref:hypothetical protein n=1 Tax=Ignatzschineria indica TaxID=472583 RepID=UPI001057F303|nr:hypothetical protein [Ignatzschineria indica]